MFRKPKRKADKSNIRPRSTAEDDDDQNKAGAVGLPQGLDDSGDDDKGGDETTSELLAEARKHLKLTSKQKESEGDISSSASMLHTFTAPSTTDTQQAHRELVTSTVQHLPTAPTISNTTGIGPDGIFRNNTRNAFHAGPVKASTNIRVTARFDYQPDVCKDYKETGFCGFGDTCIYLHDRGDTLTGWQLEQQWQAEQDAKKRAEQAAADKMMGAAAASADRPQLEDDGLPFACHVCRQAFTNPVVTKCGHYFCEACIMQHVQSDSLLCPVCQKDTHGVFNQPIKLEAKLRKALGSSQAAKAPDAWQRLYELR